MEIIRKRIQFIVHFRFVWVEGVFLRPDRPPNVRHGVEMSLWHSVRNGVCSWFDSRLDAL
jgi:hypothetical protein